MKRGILNFTKTAAMIIVVGVLLVFTSCENSDSISTNDMDVDAVLDETYVAAVYDEVEDIGDEAMYAAGSSTMKSTEGHGRGHMRLSDCVTVTKVEDGDTLITTIDFGEEYCLCEDERVRRGKIIITHTGSYWDDVKEIVFTFEDFYVDSNQITGTKTVTRYINEDTLRQSDVIVDGAMILANDEGTITRTSTKSRIVVEGSDTRFKHDDVIEVTGNSKTVLADGSEITSEILTPLVRLHNKECRKQFVSGTKRTIEADGTEILIDFGDGECDNIATVTKDGEVTTIELDRKHKKHRHGKGKGI